MEINIKTKKITQNFLKEIVVDENFWNQWSNSPACFLNDKEQLIIENFILTGDHYFSSMLLNIPYDNASTTFQNCKRRIEWAYYVFQKWLTEKILEDRKIINYTSDLEIFLHTPIGFSNRECPETKVDDIK